MFAIGIPTLNRADLLLPSLEKYVHDFPDVEIYVIDNGEQDIKNWVDWKGLPITVFEEKENLGVAASWNKLCKHIYNTHEYALIINDDVYLGYNTQTIKDVIKQNRLIVQSRYNFSVLLINKELYHFVGEFDEIFYPAYYEDSDYIYRLKLLGIKHSVDERLNPINALISQTYEKAPELVNNAMEKNRLRYIEKWGGSPLLEIFTEPYNNQ